MKTVGAYWPHLALDSVNRRRSAEVQQLRKSESIGYEDQAATPMRTRKVRWLSTQGKFALNGIDGLYFDHGTLITVHNGTTPERVVVFTLDTSLKSITSEHIIERSTRTLGDPTHGVVVNHYFYYIANSGWDVIDEHGQIRSGATTSRARIMRAQTAHRCRLPVDGCGPSSAGVWAGHDFGESPKAENAAAVHA